MLCPECQDKDSADFEDCETCCGAGTITTTMEIREFQELLKRLRSAPMQLKRELARFGAGYWISTDDVLTCVETPELLGNVKLLLLGGNVFFPASEWRWMYAAGTCVTLVVDGAKRYPQAVFLTPGGRSFDTVMDAVLTHWGV